MPSIDRKYLANSPRRRLDTGPFIRSPVRHGRAEISVRASSSQNDLPRTGAARVPQLQGKAEYLAGFRASRDRLSLPASFDHLVGPGDQRRRKLDVQGAGSARVDDKVELGRLLHRQFSGPGTA